MSTEPLRHVSESRQKTVLTIAGSDSGGGAGIQADLRVFAALGIFGASVVTALTAQNSRGVQAVWLTPPALIESQLDAVVADYSPAAVKVGMLGSAGAVDAVADRLEQRQLPNVVLDPVLASTSGTPLLDLAGQARLLDRLLPLADLVTPNLPEARRLTGLPIERDPEALAAARWFLDRGARGILLKGGHRPDAPRDLLLIANRPPLWIEGTRIQTGDLHGTGCVLAAAIAARLAQGCAMEEAVRQAKRFLEAAIRGGIRPGSGRGCLDPMAGSGLFAPDGGAAHAARMARLRGLYVVTDSRLRPDRDARTVVMSAIAGGAAAVQLREKELGTPQLVGLSRELAASARDAGTLFLVNDRVDVAMAADADGVHVGPDDMTPADARRLLGPDRLLGVSVGTIAEAQSAATYASYFGVGAIFGSRTKTDAGPAVGPARIAEIRAAAPGIPIVAIGGIDAGNIGEVAAAGAEAAAVVSAVVTAPDMAAAVRELEDRFRRGQALRSSGDARGQ